MSMTIRWASYHAAAGVLIDAATLAKLRTEAALRIQFAGLDTFGLADEA